MKRGAGLGLVLLAACGGDDIASNDGPTDAIAIDAPPGIDADKSAACADEFGTALTNSFGRIDGTLIAIVDPGNEACALPNGTHVTLQIMMNGAVYRIVTNVLSTSANPHVWLGATDAPLAGPAWAEGWHTGAPLDYVSTLHVTKSQFTESDQPTATARLDALELGTHLSVFGTSSGGTTAGSAHLIHRNDPDADGAIVIDPESAAPHYLLTAFGEQTF